MRKKILLVTAGAILFNLIFWQEKLGLNALLFDAFIIAVIFHLYPLSKNDINVRWVLAGHIISLGMVLMHNTLLSKISFLTTFSLFASFALYTHRSPWYAGASLFNNFARFVYTFLTAWRAIEPRKSKAGNLGKWLRLFIFPFVLLAVFFIIYQFSNQVFADLTGTWSAWFDQFLSRFLQWFSLGRLLFLLFGFYLVGSILLRTKNAYYQSREIHCTNALARKRNPNRKENNGFVQFLVSVVLGKFSKGNLALKNEHTIGIISLLLLNLLLLVINFIDIRYIWFNFEFTPDKNLYAMVHQGTELLIVSIILAMWVVLFFFKGNLNFYKRNAWLKYGAYAWIAQNSLLVISVFLRDYYYIVYYGLAYKRIGVLFFLLAVLTGLVTVLIKIYLKKTNYFLFRVNAWALIIMLVVSSTVNWDVMITEYNFNHNKRVPVDLQFLFTLSDKTLPSIDKHLNAETIQKLNLSDRSSRGNLVCHSCYLERLKEREKHYIDDAQNYSWLSWNYADASVQNYFSKRNQKALSINKK